MMKLKFWFNENYCLLLILTVASALRIYHIDFQSLWLDEVLSMNDANPRLNFKQFYDSVLFWESFPHLYFLLLKFSLSIFGNTTLVARILSSIIGIYGIYAIYLLGKELFNKRVGLIASALAGVNIFHIFYSQEVRPYGMFFLFTILGFYRLAILTRRPSYKNAIIYGCFAGLTINSHFFGFTALLAQCLILFLCLLKVPKKLKKEFFIYCLISALIILFFILPIYDALLQLGKIKSFWVPKPTWDILIVMFNEFFGNSQNILVLVCAITIYFIIRLFKQKLSYPHASEFINNRMAFSSLILFAWVTVSIAIPLAKSYLGISVMVTRYFINLIPVFILTVAVGIDEIKIKTLRSFVLGCILALSLWNLLYVKDYYNSPSKTQLREITDAIKSKNSHHSKIVTYYSWIFPYFFKDQQIPFEGKSLEEYIQDMRNKSVSRQAFWYADVNSRPYNLSSADETYLNQNFIQQEKLIFFDVWANYYVPKQAQLNKNQKLDLNLFSHASFDEKGNLILSKDANARTSFFPLLKGNYNLVIKGNTLIGKKINGKNANLKVRLNGKIIGDFFINETRMAKEFKLPFEIQNDQQVRLQLMYIDENPDNKQAKKIIVYSIEIIKT